MKLQENAIIGLIKPDIDVHTLGISTISNILKECGYKTFIATPEVMKATSDIEKINNLSLVLKWIKDSGINALGYSYRLDPQDGCNYFCRFYNLLSDYKLFKRDGGPINFISFAGLPDTCKLIKQSLDGECIFFQGDETPIESLQLYGVPPEKFPKSYTEIQEYDKSLYAFASKYIESEKYKLITPQDHFGYKSCGTNHDSFVDRLHYCLNQKSLPIIRVHAGPYSPNRLEAVKEYQSWVKELAASRLLDVLSIGSSQLTQQHFGEDWEGLHNGGGVPINSELEYRQIAELAKPMLVRTYAGTKNVPWMAEMHERSLNISWHALSYWWFCELDGRGNNSLLDNLKEHIETIKYVAKTNKPLEPNVPHHFSFRGGDDITYIISGYIAAKTAKKYGIKHLILQNMLNTPKYTWGVQDIAKGRAMLKLVRSLEDQSFSVSLQCRAGLDYFAPDLDKAKVQLAAITALMDDIEPENPNSPEIIHVVSYSEAVRLATPPVIKESIKITLGALQEYRVKKSLGLTFNTVDDFDIRNRYESMYEEAKKSIDLLEKTFTDLYTPDGLCRLYTEGFFPTPYILDADKKFTNATKWTTIIVNGGVRVVDEKGRPIDTYRRYLSIINNLQF